MVLFPTQIEVVSLEDGMAKGGLWLQDTAADTTVNLACGVPPPIGTNVSGSSIGDGEGYYESSSFYEFAVEWTEDRFRSAPRRTELRGEGGG